MNGINLMKTYIKTIIPNVDISCIPKQINVAFDGGAFNGYYGLGVGIFLKELENSRLTTVKRISGVSAGSVLALWYLLEQPITDLNNYFVTMSNHFKKTFNLRIYESQVRTIVLDNISTDNLSFLTKRLYISYYDTIKCRRKTVSKYRNREHLISCIVRSSHIPFIVSESITYKGRYVDGISPFIFDSKVKTLFVKVTTCSKLTRMFITGTEKNILYRLIVGVADANEFFTTGSSDMCSYVNDWNILERMAFCFREIGFCFLYYIVSYIVYLKDNRPDKYFSIWTGIKEASRNMSWIIDHQQLYS